MRPTYLFFFPWLNSGSRTFSNSSTPPSTVYFSAISVPNFTTESRSPFGDSMNIESVSE